MSNLASGVAGGETPWLGENGASGTGAPGCCKAGSADASCAGAGSGWRAQTSSCASGNCGASGCGIASSAGASCGDTGSGSCARTSVCASCSGSASGCGIAGSADSSCGGESGGGRGGGSLRTSGSTNTQPSNPNQRMWHTLIFHQFTKVSEIRRIVQIVCVSEYVAHQRPSMPTPYTPLRRQPPSK